MPPTPPPPEPVEPPVHADVLPAGGYPYDGLFRCPSILVFAGAMNADRQRQDLPNPLLSTEPIFPQLPEQAFPHDSDSFPGSNTSSRRSSASERSPARSPPPEASRPTTTDQAFDDPSFRTLPLPPGMTWQDVRPMPLPTAHLHAYSTSDDTVEYDTDSTYGGPHMRYVTSSDMIPWHVTRDWTTRNVSIGGSSFTQRQIFLEGRGARRRIKVWKKREGADRRGSNDSRGGEEEHR